MTPASASRLFGRRPGRSARTGGRVVFGFLGLLRWSARFLRKTIVYGFALIVGIVILGFLANAMFHSRRNVAYRDLACPVAQDDGWPDLALAKATNDEASLARHNATWRERLSCAIQRHSIPMQATGAPPRALSYDLAFLEFQDDGAPYLLRDANQQVARDSKGRAVGQLDDLLRTLRDGGPYFVIAFAHGWRHDASIGDGNVADLRVYAAHAARALKDRCASGDARYCAMRIMAVYLGWRGSRADETGLVKRFGFVGTWIGNFAALFTLFDRKPVSEAIAPAAISALRSIQDTLRLSAPIADTGFPPDNPNRMIVFGHSLGGNMLMVGLKDQIVKAVARHQPTTYLPPPLGDLVVLINPASEAANWTAIQRAFEQHIPTARSEKASGDDYF